MVVVCGKLNGYMYVVIVMVLQSFWKSAADHQRQRALDTGPPEAGSEHSQTWIA